MAQSILTEVLHKAMFREGIPSMRSAWAVKMIEIIIERQLRIITIIQLYKGTRMIETSLGQ